MHNRYILPVALPMLILAVTLVFACGANVQEIDTDETPLSGIPSSAPVSEPLSLTVDERQASPSRPAGAADVSNARRMDIPDLAGTVPPAPPSSITQPLEELSTVEVVRRLTPSVVLISSKMPDGSFGGGTGLILDTGGHVLTNSHVIEGSVDVEITLPDDRRVSAEVVGADSITDIAVLRMPIADVPPATLGNSSGLEVGETVIAIGHALGISGPPTVSRGVVSALGRSLERGNSPTIVGMIQTDASINQGNSGGPLVNTSAEVVGINTARMSSGQGIGFAIGIDNAKMLADHLIEDGFIERGYIGIRPSTVTQSMADQLGIDRGVQGILVLGVVPDTPADDAGIHPLDIILEMNGRTMSNLGELFDFLLFHRSGETVDIVLLRDGQEVNARITLGSRESG